LLSTILARDANAPPQAIIEHTKTKQTSFVSTNEEIDADTEVVKIRDKQVKLENSVQP
jgi:hypothetical protein